MRDANTTGYGATGNPSHPYHAEFGPDTYFPSKPGETELRGLYRKAEQGLRDMHVFMAAKAMDGDVNAMAAWDAMMAALSQAGYPGLSCGRAVTWQESVFNPDRVRRTA